MKDLKLSELKLRSFVTSLNVDYQQTAKGGQEANNQLFTPLPTTYPTRTETYTPVCEPF